MTVETSSTTESNLASTMRAPQHQPSRSPRWGISWSTFGQLLFLTLLSAFLCFYKIGDWSFGNGDQTIHSKVVQEMVHNGNYLKPTNEGRPYFNKPPLKMWGVAAIVQVFGESNTTYRVLDGIVGVLITLAVYFIGRALFASSLAGFFSALYLLGCELFFWGHGVRNATQDALMLFFVVGVVYLGYRIHLQLRATRPAKEIIERLSLYAGVLTGLAVMTKSAAGLIGAVIVVVFFLSTRQLIPLIRNHARAVAIGAFSTILIPATYWIPHFIVRPRTYWMVVDHEILRRATVGYHNTTDELFYFAALFDDRLLVVPEILVLALLFGAWRCYRGDTRFLFLLCWSLVPIAVYSAVRSKLTWYILPAAPGMSILAGALTWMAYERLIYLLRTPFRLSAPQKLWTLGYGIFVCALLGGATFHIYRANKLLLLPGVRLPTDRIVAFELRQLPRDSSHPRVALFRIPVLAREEPFYWDMLGTTPTRDLESLLAAYKQSPERFYIVTKVGHIPRIAEHLNIEAYTLLPPRGLRRQWLAVLYLGGSPVASELHPVREEILPRKMQPAFGLSFPQNVSTGSGRVSPSGRGGILLEGNYIHRQFGTKLSLTLAPLKRTDATASVQLFLNDHKIASAELSDTTRELQTEVAPQLWERGKNLLTIQATDGFVLTRIAIEPRISKEYPEPDSAEIPDENQPDLSP